MDSNQMLEYRCKTGQTLFIKVAEVANEEDHTSSSLPVKKLCSVATQTDDLGCSNGCTSIYITTKSTLTKTSPGNDKHYEKYPSGMVNISIKENKLSSQQSTSYAQDLTAVLQVLNEADNSNSSNETLTRDIEVHDEIHCKKVERQTVPEADSLQAQLAQSGVDFHTIESISVCNNNSREESHEVGKGKQKAKKSKEMTKSPNFIFVGYNSLSNSNQKNNNNRKRSEQDIPFSMVLDKIPITKSKKPRLNPEDEAAAKKIFTCNTCHEVFDLSECTKHSEMSHQISCTFCKLDFDSDTLLIHHISPDDINSSHQCSVCSKTLACKSYLVRHVLTHSEPKAFTCHECSQSFQGKNELNMHMLVHRDKPLFSCHLCDKIFGAKCSLAKHVKTKHSEGQERTYKCSECGKGFWCNFTYKRHLLIHSGQKPYKCSVCGRDFRQDNHLKEHFKRKHSIHEKQIKK